MFRNKNLRLNISKTKTAMNVKISVFVICVKAIIYLSLCKFHDCTFKYFYIKHTGKIFSNFSHRFFTKKWHIENESA